MKRPPPLRVKSRRICSRLSPLLVVCQRTPVSQAIAREVGMLGMSGFRQAAQWSVALVTGLGSYDSVSGATLVKQIAPSAGSATVSATNGSALSFVVQVTGAPSTAKSWKLTGTLPTGLTHANATNSNTDSVTGVPRQNGSFPVTITAYEKAGYTGGAKAASFTITVTGGVSPPVISAQPGAISVNQGASAVLAVSATGAVSYQWYLGPSGNVTQPIAGAGAASYTTPPLAISSSFWVKVTNTGGSVNSNAALVSVVVPPAISTQPVSAHLNPGGSTTLSVTAAGTSPAFQWYAGLSGDLTNPIPGAVASTFTTPALPQTSRYWVKVTNPAGTVDSDTAVLTIDIPAGISAQPVSTSITPGTSTMLSVTATGTTPAYQWYAGLSGDLANPISGATGSTFTTPILTDSARYWVLVGNSAGFVNSNTAIISLLDNFDSWAAGQFSPAQQADATVSGPVADPDGDGLGNTQEFVFGTIPLAANLSLNPVPTLTEGGFSLSFTAAAAAGPGYAGLVRHFAVESSGTLGSGSLWTAVSGFTDIIAQGQVVQFTAPIGTGPAFYRLKAWLLPL